MKNKYRYELHAHTSESSICGRIKATELVDLYHDSGYSGLVITDHLYDNPFLYGESLGNWNNFIGRFLTGFYLALNHARKYNMDVLMGAEIRFKQNNNDYLLYGLDEDILKDMKEPFEMGINDFYRKYKNDILIIQAHPYRDGNTNIDINYLHGIELVNTNPRHNNNNDKALSLSKSHPDFLRIYGSDTHRIGDESRSAIVFDSHCHTSRELAERIKSGN